MSKATDIHKDIHHVLFTQEQIAARISQLGREIAEDCRHDRPLLLAALNGACMFLSDLVRSIDPVPDGINLDFIRASSYNSISTAASEGNIKLGDISEGKFDVRGRNIIIVEDIVDSGHTAKKLIGYLRSLGATSVKLVALLDKSERRSCELAGRAYKYWIPLQRPSSPWGPEEHDVQCPDEFVVGYGMDYNEEYRTLPYVGVLKAELYQG